MTAKRVQWSAEPWTAGEDLESRAHGLPFRWQLATEETFEMVVMTEKDMVTMLLAVNAHAELVAALRDMTRHAENARAALAKVQP